MTVIRNILTMLSVLVTFAGFAQFDTAFVYTYGGGLDDRAYDMIETLDGGYCIVGSTSSFGHGSTDMYVVKLDSNFAVQWTNAFGGPQIDEGRSIVEHPFDGYVALGSTNSFGSGGYDLYVVRIDAMGNLMYYDTYGGADWDFGYDIVPAPNNEFLLVGETHSFGNGESDGYLVHTNVFLEDIWTHTAGGTGTDVLYHGFMNFRGELSVVGESNSYSDSGDYDVYIVDLPLAGDTVKEFTFGTDYDDGAYDAIELSDSSTVFCGYSNADHDTTDRDIYLTKFNANRIVEWHRFQAGSSSVPNNPDEGYSIAENAAGDLLVAGYTSTFGAGEQDIRISLNAFNGWQYFSTTYGDFKSDEAREVIPLGDHGAILLGTTGSYGAAYKDIFLIKMDSVFSFANPENNPNVIFSSHIDTLISDTLTGLVEVEDLETLSISVHDSRVKIISKSEPVSFDVFDVLGKLVYEHPIEEREAVSTDLPRGMYLVHISCNNSSISGSIKSKILIYR